MSARVRASVPPALAVVALYVAVFAILQSSWIAEEPTVISAALAFDLMVTSSLLVWWLGVRRAQWPRWTIAAAVGLGLLTARTMLPDADVVTVLVGVWLAGELALAMVAIARIRTIARVARAHDGPGPIAALAAGLVAARVPARVAEIVATDLVVIGMGITGWFRTPRPGFTMHRTNGWALIIGVFLALTIVETVLVHIVVVQWSVLAAWILTGLSIYSALWLAADLHVSRLHPVRVTDDTIYASVGVRWRAEIPRAAIREITLVREAPKDARDLGLGGANVALALVRPVELRGLFGIRRTATTIALTIDEPERFIARSR